MNAGQLFGSPEPPPTLEDIVARLRNSDVRALTSDEQNDLVTLVEFVQKRALESFGEAVILRGNLDRREAELVKRERDVALKLRVAGLVPEAPLPTFIERTKFVFYGIVVLFGGTGTILFLRRLFDV